MVGKVIKYITTWDLYLKARFPVLSLGIFTFLLAAGSENVIKGHVDFKALLVGMLFLAFFFHLRLLDEFKDFEYDTKFHKDRPVQAGLITLRTIKSGVAANLVFMATLSIYMEQALLFALTIGYTLLMFKEFFVRKFFLRSSVLYLISHEMVFVPLSALMISFYAQGNPLLTVNNLLLIVYCVIAVTLIEVGRKMKNRYDQNGKVTNDTYAYIWGEKQTALTFFSLCFINSLVLVGLANQTVSYIISTTCLVLLIAITTNKKARETAVQNNMKVTTVSVLLFPLLLLI